MMAKKEMKRLARRSLAMFMTLVMTISMLQLQVFATDEENVPNQTMEGWYVTEDGVVTSKVTKEEFTEDMGFKLSKTIEQTGVNAFDITLKVVTSQTVTTNEAAIQLVIDTSSSMKYCSVCGKQKDSGNVGGGYPGYYPGIGGYPGYYPGMGGNNGSGSCECETDTDNRLTAVKKILTEDNGFLDSLVAANTGAINVSVVAYDLNAETVYDWVDIKDSDNLEAVKDAINDLNDMGNGTNTHAGLMLAGNRLSEVANAGVKYTILLTDGYANCVGKESDSKKEISLSGDAPIDVGATTAGTNGAKNMIADLSAESTVFVVGYGVEASYLEDIVDGNGTIIVGEDADTISKAFKNVAQSAVTGMNGAGTSVIDPMGQFITLNMDEVPAALADKGVSKVGNSIRWELNPGKADAIDPSEDGKTTTYTYTITYPITLDTTADDFVEGYYYPTNGYTYLSVPTDDGIVEIPFNVPGVCGEIPEVNWTVEYYLQNADSIGSTPTYTEAAEETYGPVDVWTTVSAPNGYENKYANYDFDSDSLTTLEVTPDAENNVMRLYYNLKTVDISGNKIWDDNNDQDGIRPDEITINLMNGDTVVASETVTADDEWAWTFENLPKYDANGNEIVYKITEAPVDGYTAEVDGYNVTNTHTPETVTISGSKTWNDNNNQDGKRPSSIIINLMNGENLVESKTVTADADGNWTWSFTAPKYAAGTEIAYSIYETPVDDYDTDYDGYNVINTYSPEVTTVFGSKTWIDNDNAYKTRPESITINLLADGTVVATKTITAADDWAWSFANLPRYADGQQISYTITENAVDGYDSTVCGHNVFNTLNNATLTINKRAAGDTDKIPGDTAFIVKNAAGETVATVYYRDFKDGSYTIKGLRIGTYTVTEDYDSAQIPHYKLKVEGGPTAKVEVAVGANAYVGFTNYYELVPYTYEVIHEFYTSLNGGEYTYDGENEAKEYSAKTTPRMWEVFDAQSLTDKYTRNGETYERKAEYSESEITAEGTLRGGDRVYTIKYYRSIWSEGGLTIKKNISGLDETSLETLKGKLSFTVKNSAGETVATVPYKDGGMTLTDPLPAGIYTIEENNAAVIGYELNVTKVTDVSTEPGYQVEVTAGAEAVTFNITNDYTSRVYNIWFDGGAHGTVYNAEDTVYRNRWLEFGEGSDAYYDWSGVGLKASGDTLYQLGSSATDKIYAGVTAETDPAISEILSAANDTRNMVMYTLTWKDYMENIETMEVKKPDLAFNKKEWVSTEEFYHNGGEVEFENLEKTLVAMNSYIDGVAAVNEDGDAVQPVYVDANGYYHIYYVAKYTQYKTPTGNLTINKTATGAEVPAGATFTISGTTVDQEAYSTSFTYQDMDNGTKTITLPQGTYTVTETGANVSGYTLSTTVNYGEGAESAVVAEEVTAVVDVVNTYTKNPTGGDDDDDIIIPKPPVIEIPEEDVPLVDIPEVEIPVTDLPEEDIPLADVPKTGETMIYRIMAAISGITLMALAVTGRKKEEEEMA